MSILNDRDIRGFCTQPVEAGCPMIDPFVEGVQGGGVVSYGLTSAGYDIRLGPDILVFKNSYGEAVDPKRFGDIEYKNRIFDVRHVENGVVCIPAHSYILGRSFEYLRIPKALKARCVGKSTYARCGVIVNTTPLEPEWEGYLTIEISNSSPCPVCVYTGEGIAQLEFEELTGTPEITYAMKGGKYQRQVGVTPAKVL